MAKPIPEVGDIYEFNLSSELKYKITKIDGRYIYVTRLNEDNSEMNWKTMMTVDELNRHHKQVKELKELKEKQAEMLQKKILVETENGDEWVTLDKAIEKGYV